MGSARTSLIAYGISLACLALTVPWLAGDLRPFGMPLWAVMSLAATVAYAVAVALGLGRVFAALDDPDDPDEPAPGAEP